MDLHCSGFTYVGFSSSDTSLPLSSRDRTVSCLLDNTEGFAEALCCWPAEVLLLSWLAAWPVLSAPSDTARHSLQLRSEIPVLPRALSQPRWPQGVPCFRLTLQAEKTARWPHQQTHNSISALCEAACSPIFPLNRTIPGTRRKMSHWNTHCPSEKSSSDEELIRGPTVQTQVTEDSPSMCVWKPRTVLFSVSH
ncbi:hypothetical protein AV530_015000 [Patagioenas fasciata monilis]|uniref:Uncharacterized protein n=1 Tax=Patagioenas fasciata monilis TaxID=372326 RepID=A0A1V4K0L1_PATFA|nr:hypothetical protein AV530_015000 [Patagioenas fasciata monilis]